jgi:hypothetical protein
MEILLLACLHRCQLATISQFTASTVASIHMTNSRVRVRATLLLAVYRQSLCLSAKPLEAHDQSFCQLNPCTHSPYVTSSLMRGWVCLLWIGFTFVKFMDHTYSIGLHGYGEWLFFLGSGRSDKSDNLEQWTSHGVWDVCLRAQPQLCVSFAAVYWPHSTASKCHLH